MSNRLTIDDRLNITVDADGMTAGIQLDPDNALAAADLLRHFAELQMLNPAPVARPPSLSKTSRTDDDGNPLLG
ncbi:MAG: hypothetical protein QM766_27565 [Burkholderiaceae bacterium]